MLIAYSTSNQGNTELKHFKQISFNLCITTPQCVNEN